MQPSFYFRWLTRRHLHVSARIATDSVKPVEPSTDPPKKPKKTRSKKSAKTDDPDGVPKKSKKRRKVTGPSLLVESKVKDFLDHVESIKHTFGLDDLERYRPERQPAPTSPEFEGQYIALRDTLCRAFTVPQLRAFFKLYRMDVPSKYTTKQSHVTMIMEMAWKWPSLEKLQKEKIDWSVSSQRSSYLPFPICSRQIIQSSQNSLWIPDGPFYSWAKVCHCPICRAHFSCAMYRWQ